MIQQRSAAGVLVGALIVLVATIGVGSGLGAGQAVHTAEASCSDELFGEDFVAELEQAVPGLAITASVFDTRSQCWYDLHPDVQLTTASAIKLHVLSANLWQHQQRGTELSATDTGYAERMLWFSHNSPATSSLYVNVGATGMAGYGGSVGASATTHTAIYGVTRGPARDLTKVALSTLDSAYPGPLDDAHRQIARDLLDGVHASQRWGISAGLPDGWTSRLKNGFFPCTNCAPFPGRYTWRVASTGMNVDETGEGYGISILTDGAGTQADGIAAVEVVSRHVAALLTNGPEVERDVDHANCTTVTSGESRGAISARLGLSTTDWTEIRWTSGNEGPLSGQLMCGAEPLAETQACICPEREQLDR